jgi:hypothetical protein
MSRASETEHAIQREAGSGAEHAPDLDAEHDPAAARRTSLAGLRRQAAATEQAQAEQHTIAEQYSAAGVRAALSLGASRIDQRTASIDTLIGSKPGDGGPALNLDIMRRHFADTFADLKRLRIELWTQSQAARTSWQREVLRMGGALERFSDAWHRAQSYASQHGEVLRENPFWIKQELDDIYGKVKLDPAIGVDHSVDERSHVEILKTSLQESLEAALECARSLRTELATGKDSLLVPDLRKLIWHLREVAAATGRGIDANVAHALRGTADKVLQIVSALESQIETRPELASEVRKGEPIPETLRHIRLAFHGR